METISVTPEQFGMLYESNFECNIPMYLDEWDCDHTPLRINIHNDFTLDYDIDGASNIGLGYRWKGVSWEELKDLVKSGFKKFQTQNHFY